MKIRDYLFFISISVLLFLSYFYFNDRLKSYVFKNMDNVGKPVSAADNLVFVSDVFKMKDYNNLINKLSEAQNSIVLFLPQLFNMKIDPYLDEVEPEDITILKQEYKEFVLKMAETSSIIPVVFVAPGKPSEEVPGLSAFSYFDKYSGTLKFHEYDYLKIKSLKVWQTVKTPGFFREYRYYPYRVPLVFKHKNQIYAGAAVEAVRKYYRLTRDQISIDGRFLRIGSIVSAPLSKYGDIIISESQHREALKLSTVLTMPMTDLADKIIIINSLNNKDSKDVNMRSLGATVSALMTGVYIKYNPASDYGIALILVGLLAAAFTGAPFLFGMFMYLIVQAGIIATGFYLLKKNVYVDVILLSASAFFVFFSIYYFKIMTARRHTENRKEFLSSVSPSKNIPGLIASNKDIKIKNTWTECFAAYFMFDENFFKDMANAKNVFDSIEKTIYTFDKDFFIYYGGQDELLVMFAGKDRDTKTLLDALMAVRDSEGLQKFNFNIILIKTFVNIFDMKKRPVVMDKNYDRVRTAHALAKQKYILIAETDIQEYINYIKFQKVSGADSLPVFFNIAGHRDGGNI
ncbi:MAG: hypothetical protein WCJ46_03700 [bacterium]